MSLGQWKKPKSFFSLFFKPRLSLYKHLEEGGWSANYGTTEQSTRTRLFILSLTAVPRAREVSCVLSDAAPGVSTSVTAPSTASAISTCVWCRSTASSTRESERVATVASTRPRERRICSSDSVLVEVCLPLITPSDFSYRVRARVRAKSRATRIVLAQ